MFQVSLNQLRFLLATSGLHKNKNNDLFSEILQLSFSSCYCCCFKNYLFKSGYFLQQN
jgi:hypothetical protein